MAEKVYIGIDPGSQGGIAAIYPEGYEPKVYFKTLPSIYEEIWDIFSHLVVASKRKEIPFESELKDAEFVAVIEKQLPGAFEGSEKSSIAKLYGDYCALCMALTAADIPYVSIPAREWHKELGISPRRKTKGISVEESKSEFKNRLKREAEKLFPRLAITLRTSDALLIAEFCRRKYEDSEKIILT